VAAIVLIAEAQGLTCGAALDIVRSKWEAALKNLSGSR
jgi:hypothetical protein